MKQHPALVLFALAASVAACHPARRSSERPAIAVSAIEIARPAMLDQTFSALGTVRADTIATLTSRMVGNVTEVRVREGDRVRRGDVLAVIDARDIMAQQERAVAAAREIESAAGVARAGRDTAEANAQLAAVTYERYRELRARNSVSPQEFDEVEARYLAARAEKERAAHALAQTSARRGLAQADISGASVAVSWSRITSPIDGVVTARWIDPGSQAAPGVPLLAVESTGHYRVEASVDEDHAAGIQPGEIVTITTRSNEELASGRVAHVAPAPDAATRSYLVWVDLPPDTTLKSGSSVTVHFPAGRRSGISIPRKALLERGEMSSVWIAAGDNTAQLRYVTPGGIAGDRVEILTGIAAGDRVILESAEPLVDGAPIVVGGSS
jgi:RND family efflux transporter MFP subunit